jgi:hypothetical protein
VAVYGFFATSGYLITGSAWRITTPAICGSGVSGSSLPSGVVSLLAFGFVLLAWFHGNAGAAQPRGPLGYVFHNLWLWIDQPGNHEHPKRKLSIWRLEHIPLESVLRVPLLWMGSLTLIGVVTKRWTVATISAATWITLVTITSMPNFNHQFIFIHYDLWKNILEHVPIFLTGSILRPVAGEDTKFRLVSSPVCPTISLQNNSPLGRQMPDLHTDQLDVNAPYIAHPLIRRAFTFHSRK